MQHGVHAKLFLERQITHTKMSNKRIIMWYDEAVFIFKMNKTIIHT